LTSVVADTHVLVWYLTAPKRLSPAAGVALDAASSPGSVICVSAISLVEIRYLVEKGTLPAAVQERIDEALDAPDVAVWVAPVDREVARSLAQVPWSDVPDMPDRIIAATALALGVPLVTRDGRIRTSAVPTIW
jgi:PIN domain nuclease of toxin-antitoxin system